MGLSRRVGRITPLDGIGFAGYALHRLYLHGKACKKKIVPDRKDPCRRPFLIEFDICRKLTGRRRRKEWGKPLKVKPVRDLYGRWDLQVKFGRRKSTYHRVVCMAAVWPR